MSLRVRLYDITQPDEPEADSDSDLAPGLPGTTIVRGLLAVTQLLSDLASTFHGDACAGLNKKTLARKVGSLRTQLSCRGDGHGTLRAYYEVTRRFGVRHKLAVCDVMRIDHRAPQVAEAICPQLFPLCRVAHGLTVKALES
jgi:hypothetical protein